MIEINTVELKTHLGAYLRKVQKGETISVTSHGHPIARIERYHTAGERMIQEPTRSIDDLREIPGIVPRKAIDGVELLLNDRSRR